VNWLGKIYKDKYTKENKEDASTVNSIIEYEKSFNESCVYWNKENLIQWIKEFNSTSIGSLNVKLSTFRKFCTFISNEENIQYKDISLDFGEMYNYLDVEQLKRITLTYMDYRHILNQMLSDNSGDGWNVRDRLIFEFAWLGLSNEEMKLIKESDIDFQGQDAVVINISNTKFFRSEDPQLIEDIKLCLNEQYHYIRSKDGRSKKMQYRDSEYLIKPVNVGRSKREDYVGNPGVVLQAAFAYFGITCEGIDIYTLSIEDIRRSKIVYLLSEENSDYFDMEFVKNLFDMSSENQMFWYKKVAKIKYSEPLK